MSSKAAWGQAITWRTGPALDAQLQQPVTYAGTDVPLRETLRNFAGSQQVAILIDRRIDPDQRLDLQLSDVSLHEALRQIADKCDAAITLAGPVVYVGPPPVTRRLRTLISLREAEVARLPLAARQRFQQQREWSWDDLATPRELLDVLAREAGIQLAGLDQVPHDLWAGVSLPPLSVTERMSLILTQFDLTFQAISDRKQAAITPISSDLAIERSYAAGPRPRERLEQWSKLCPDSHVELRGDRIVVRGLLEDHERIAAPSAATSQRPTTVGERRYTLTVQEQPVGRLIEALGRQLKLEVRLDQAAITAAGISLDQRVSFRVNQVTLDALFEAALKPAGLVHRQEENVIVVTPGK